MMAQINVTNLTFCYDGSFDNVFEDVSFSVDTDWEHLHPDGVRLFSVSIERRAESLPGG